MSIITLEGDAHSVRTPQRFAFGVQSFQTNQEKTSMTEVMAASRILRVGTTPLRKDVQISEKRGRYADSLY